MQSFSAFKVVTVAHSFWDLIHLLTWGYNNYQLMIRYSPQHEYYFWLCVEIWKLWWSSNDDLAGCYSGSMNVYIKLLWAKYGKLCLPCPSAISWNCTVVVFASHCHVLSAVVNSVTFVALETIMKWLHVVADLHWFIFFFYRQFSDIISDVQMVRWTLSAVTWRISWAPWIQMAKELYLSWRKWTLLKAVCTIQNGSDFTDISMLLCYLVFTCIS